MCWRRLACFDDVVGEAAVAKGTFYLPFDGLAGLQGAVGDELAHEFDELLQPRRLATQDPIERIAAGCGAFVGEALRKPAWGRARGSRRPIDAERCAWRPEPGRRPSTARKGSLSGDCFWRKHLCRDGHNAVLRRIGTEHPNHVPTIGRLQLLTWTRKQPVTAVPSVVPKQSVRAAQSARPFHPQEDHIQKP